MKYFILIRVITVVLFTLLLLNSYGMDTKNILVHDKEITFKQNQDPEKRILLYFKSGMLEISYNYYPINHRVEQTRSHNHSIANNFSKETLYKLPSNLNDTARALIVTKMIENVKNYEEKYIRKFHIHPLYPLSFSKRKQ